MNICDLDKVEGYIESSRTLSDKWLSITINSRETDGFSVFLAIKGDRFDAHDFVESILRDDKLDTVIIDNEKLYNDLKIKYPHKTLIRVKETLKFFQESARYKMSLFKQRGAKVLALTGSNGKTTNKEMLFHIAKSFQVETACTQGNLNNLVGVPLTIHQQIKKETEFAIIEMGAGKPGDIEYYCYMVQPDYGYVTNIGLAHIEFLKDKEGVYHEKTALYRYIKKSGGKFFVNTSDVMLVDLSGEEHTIDCSHLGIQNESLKEVYNLENLNASAFIIGTIFNDMEKAKNAAASFAMPKMNRSEWVKVGEKEVFLDAYNANPSSMEKSLESFVKNCSVKNSLFILGDMNELGESTEAQHSFVAEKMNELGIEKAVFIGRYSHFYQKVFRGESNVFVNVDEFLAVAKNVLNSYNFIFLKGSRSLQLERILDIKDKL